jgi:sec-independent protein translocase protein TatA
VIGFWEAAILIGIIIVVFGAGKLPTVMGDLAKGLKSFKAEMGSDKPDGTGAAPAAGGATPAGAPQEPPGLSGPPGSVRRDPPVIDVVPTEVATTGPVPPRRDQA